MEDNSYWSIFKDASTKYPNNAAVCYNNPNNTAKYSYKMLNEICANIYACMGKILSTSENIGVLIKHEFLIPPLLAMIHRCHCSFVFLDPTENESTNTQIIKDLGINKIFSTNDLLVYDGYKATKLSYTEKINDISLYLWENISIKHQCIFPLKDIAYCIKTSGSTSIAKLVAVPHTCIYPNVCDFYKLFHLKCSDVIYFCTPLTFDPSVIEIYLAAFAGAALMISSNILTAINTKGNEDIISVTMWQTTPSIFLKTGLENVKKYLLNNTSPLRILALGGESFCDLDKLKQLRHKENSTDIFNLYGITEVSCWASVCKVILSSSGDEVPLGNPLTDTFLQICDNDGKHINLGIGNIMIGSKIRKCLLESDMKEFETKQQIMFDNTTTLWRSTNDLGEIKSDGKMYFLGRFDRVIKRYGHKVNLLNIEKVAASFTDVKQAACVWLHRYHTLVLIITSQKDVENKLRQFLENRLERQSVPDHIYTVDCLPLNKHGKISISKAYAIYQTELKPKAFVMKHFFLDKLKEVIPDCSSVENYISKSFVELGGNSISAMRLMNEIENVTNVNYPDMFANLTDPSCTLSSVLSIIETSFNNFNDDTIKKIPENDETARKRSLSTDEHRSKKMNLNSLELMTSIEIVWKIDLGKCIDANPVLYICNGLEYVIVGSHSGKILVAYARTGVSCHIWNVFSRVEAPVLCFNDESSNHRAVVGCYDGTLWCFSLSDYEVVWKVPLKAMIKSKACHYQTDIFVATYDSIVWNICAKTGNILRSLIVAHKGICADLVISDKIIYAAALDGTCMCIEFDKLKSKWQRQLSSPVFAKPTLLNNDLYVIFTEVKGTLHCFDSQTGIELWKFSAAGSIFSSCQVDTSAGETSIVFGCHNCYSYNLISNNNVISLRHRVKHTAEVYATPCSQGESNSITVSTNGHLQITNMLTKVAIVQFNLPGQVFSSPVTLDHFIFIGCRDNNLYCLKIVS